MKKALLSAMSAVVFVICCMCMVHAADMDTPIADEQAETYAYMDLETADSATQEKILKARKAIIYSKEWVADGHTAYVADVITDEIIRYLPAFSEVFPEWDIPVEEIAEPTGFEPFPSQTADTSSFDAVDTNAEATVNTTNSTSDDSDWLNYVAGNLYLQAASEDEIAEPFITFTVDPYEIGTKVRTYATSLPDNTTCNLGYTDASTGKSLLSATNLTVNQAIVIDNAGNMELSVRASTYDNPGWATVAIDGAYRLGYARILSK